MTNCPPFGRSSFSLSDFLQSVGRLGDVTASRSGRRRKQFDSAELKLVILALLSEQPRHGYEVIRAVEDMSHGAYSPSPGLVYPIITMLADMGLIEEVSASPSRKSYQATDAGRRHAAEHEAEIALLFDRIDQLGEGPRKANSAAINRAVQNLLTVLGTAATSDDVTDARINEITAMMDDLSRRIEQLK